MTNTYDLIYEKLYNYYGPQGWWPADSPFEVIIGAILVQNTNWNNAEKALKQLQPYMDSKKLLQLSTEKLGTLIKPSGFYNIKTKRIIAFCEWFANYEFSLDKLSKLPPEKLRDKLLNVYGIGPETADVILLYVFEYPVFVVDKYARRIFKRFGLNVLEQYDDVKKAVESNVNWGAKQFNEFHALIVAHAKKHCKTNPHCKDCPLKIHCEQKLN